MPGTRPGKTTLICFRSIPNTHRPQTKIFPDNPARKRGPGTVGRGMLEKRPCEHPAGFERDYRGRPLVLVEAPPDHERCDAARRAGQEAAAAWKPELIERRNPPWRDLYDGLLGSHPALLAPETGPLGPRFRAGLSGENLLAGQTCFDAPSTNIKSSWPGLTRPSTPSGARSKDVDARIKSAQDDFRLFPTKNNIPGLKTRFSPDSPARKREPGDAAVLQAPLRARRSCSRHFEDAPQPPTIRPTCRRCCKD